jgi:hypothetical protein
MMIPALVLSVALASLFLAMIRLGAPKWSFLALGVLPPALLFFLAPGMRVYGYHGFIQAGIAYQMLNGSLPPTSPLLAGMPGAYPWAGALVVATIAKTLGISLFWASAVLSMVALLALLIATYRIGLLVTGNAESSLFGTTLALYAFTFTQSVPDNSLKDVLRAILPLPFEEPRGAPILEKFNGCTAFPLGIALYAIAFLLLLQLAKRSSPHPLRLAGFAASLVAVAFVYPYLLPSMALLCLGVAALAWRSGGPGKRLAVHVSTAVVVAAALALPYYLHLKAGRAGPALQLASLLVLMRDLAVIVVTFLPMSILLAWGCRPVRATLRGQGRAATIALVSVVLNLVLFAVLMAPLWSQHNYLLLAIFALGIVGGTALRALRLRTWAAALGVLSLFLIPFSLDCIHKARDWKDAPRDFLESGTVFEPTDPDQRALYSWMRTQTDPRAAFVDTNLALPVFGQRALFVALPKQEEMKALTTEGGDGYTLDPRIFLKIVDGYSETLVDRRLRIARRLLAGEPPSRAELAEIAASGPHSYLILRPDSPGAARSQLPAFPVVFQNAAATVIELPR